MPLVQGSSKKAIQENIKREAGTRPIKQAVAIAYSVARKSKKKKKSMGGGY